MDSTKMRPLTLKDIPRKKRLLLLSWIGIFGISLYVALGTGGVLVSTLFGIICGISFIYVAVLLRRLRKALKQ